MRPSLARRLVAAAVTRGTFPRGIWVVAVLVSVCLTFLLCSYVFPDPNPDSIVGNSDLEVFWYEGGRPMRMCKLTAQSTGAREIVHLIKRHRRQWMVNFGSCAPDLFIQGADFSIDIGKHALVLNYVQDGRDIQAISLALPSEAGRIRDVLKSDWRRFED
jgi:hypothetical protein